VIKPVLGAPYSFGSHHFRCVATLSKMGDSILGMKGLTLRNTFLEFKDEEDTLTLDGFKRQGSEPAKPPSMRQVSEQTTSDESLSYRHGEGSMPSRNTTADPSNLSAEFKLGRMPPASDEHPSSIGMGMGMGWGMGIIPGMSVPGGAWEAALMAVQQSLAAPLPQLQPAAVKLPAQRATAARQGPSFCPDCGSKVKDPTHRFCAYCCFPLKDLQQEAASAPLPAGPPDMSFPMDLGLGMSKGMTLNPSAADMAAAAALVAQHQALQQQVDNQRLSLSLQQDNIMTCLQHFRFVDAQRLDVEHAKAVCLSYLSASGQKGGARRPKR